MPKAKPVSLHPLSFEQAIDALIKAPPKPQKPTALKPKKGKTSSHRAAELNDKIAKK